MQTCQTHQILYLKWVYFIVCKLYPSKTNLKYILRDQLYITSECLFETSEE